jgi:hypothetical protein
MGVALELIVSCSEPGDRIEPLIDALLWSVKRDATLLESQRFSSGAGLRVWLKSIIAEHGRGSIRVRWTDTLTGNFALSHLIAVCLGVSVPRAQAGPEPGGEVGP